MTLFILCAFVAVLFSAVSLVVVDLWSSYGYPHDVGAADFREWK